MKITRDLLKKMINEEAAKFDKPIPVEDVEAEETEAADLANSLLNHVDHSVKEELEKKAALAEALRLEEGRLLNRIRLLREARRRVAREMLGIK